jgi:ArsR family transcriptional regulator
MNPIAFFKCLADETRLRILLLTQHESELCVCELTEALRLSQPKISRHLAQLRNCGLLETRRDGQWVFYRLHPELPSWAQKVLEEVGGNYQAFIQVNQKRLVCMGNRPQRLQECC